MLREEVSKLSEPQRDYAVSSMSLLLSCYLSLDLASAGLGSLLDLFLSFHAVVELFCVGPCKIMLDPPALSFSASVDSKLHVCTDPLCIMG